MAKEVKQPKRAPREDREGRSTLTVLTAPAGATGCSVDGVEYPVVDGQVQVSAHHVAALEPHGFRRVDADA